MTKNEQAAAAAEAAALTGDKARTMDALPAMPRAGRRAKALHGCACGCGMPTRSTWHPGHDGRATGWAIRVERGILTMDEIPANERKGAEIMLSRRKAHAKARVA